MTPAIQNAALRELGLNMVNVALHVTADNLESAVEGARSLGFLGLMVTIPHKVAVIRHLDMIDESAEIMGTVNLVQFSHGKAIGYNSDGYAARRSLEESGIEVAGSRMAILGAGGAGKCLARRFAADGAISITLLNRTVDRALSVVREIKPTDQQRISAQPLTEEVLAALLPETDVLVNATSVGMVPYADETPVPKRLLHQGLVVYDIVYNPLETRLLREAREVGAVAVDGVGMLAYTNERAVQICTGSTPSVELMRQVCVEELHRRSLHG